MDKLDKLRETAEEKERAFNGLVNALDVSDTARERIRDDVCSVVLMVKGLAFRSGILAERAVIAARAFNEPSNQAAEEGIDQAAEFSETAFAEMVDDLVSTNFSLSYGAGKLQTRKEKML